MTKKPDTSGLEGILGGLKDLIGGLADLAEKGQTLRQSGVGGDDKTKVVYGFTVRGLGGGDSGGVRVEPFGNVRRDADDHATVSDIREPAIDLIEEADHTLVVAEMPGVGAADIRFTAEGDLLTITADTAAKKYHKEVTLPHPVDAARVTVSVNNGIAEIRCSK